MPKAKKGTGSKVSPKPLLQKNESYISYSFFRYFAGTCSISQTWFTDSKKWKPSRHIAAASTWKMTGRPWREPTFSAVSRLSERCTYNRFLCRIPCCRIAAAYFSPVPWYRIPGGSTACHLIQFLILQQCISLSFYLYVWFPFLLQSQKLYVKVVILQHLLRIRYKKTKWDKKRRWETC